MYTWCSLANVCIHNAEKLGGTDETDLVTLTPTPSQKLRILQYLNSVRKCVDPKCRSTAIHQMLWGNMKHPLNQVAPTCIWYWAGQDQGGPRWDTLTKKPKSTKLLHIVLCYTQGVVAYDPVLFWGCIPPPLTPLRGKPEDLILISIGGRTLQRGVMYIFMFLCYQNWLLSPTVELASQRAY